MRARAVGGAFFDDDGVNEARGFFRLLRHPLALRKLGAAEIMAKDLVGRGFAGSSRCRGIFVRDRLRSLDIDGFVGLAESLKSYQKMTSSQDP